MQGCTAKVVSRGCSAPKKLPLFKVCVRDRWQDREVDRQSWSVMDSDGLCLILIPRMDRREGREMGRGGGGERLSGTEGEGGRKTSENTHFRILKTTFETLS